MVNDNYGFVQLCETLADEIDLFGDGPPIPPTTLKEFQDEISKGAKYLPQIYRISYVEQLMDNLSSVEALLDKSVLETLTGAVYEHASDRKDVWQPLNRFLAVISNLYRSFLSKAKRAEIGIPLKPAVNIPLAAAVSETKPTVIGLPLKPAVDIPLVGTIPPLAMFQHSGANGPFTIPSDQVNQVIGVNIGVVSLPSTYRDHPLLWASLAHETGGHDVTHADPGLLPELAAGIETLFGVGLFRPDQPLTDRLIDGLLWSYWIDETTADVYGLLNIGPAFAINLAAFFAALNNRGAGNPIPTLRTQSGTLPDGLTLDPHPMDILRLHIAIGVIETLNGLSPDIRNGYIAQLEQLAKLCAQRANTVEIQGMITVDDWPIPLNIQRPLEDMQRSARLVGAYIATTNLQALANHSIQDIETWDDTDELTTQRIITAFRNRTPVINMGDDAQLLAGATLALVAQPALYNSVTQGLNDALDQSYAQDPIWGPPKPHPVFVRYREAAGRLTPQRYSEQVDINRHVIASLFKS